MLAMCGANANCKEENKVVVPVVRQSRLRMEPQQAGLNDGKGALRLGDAIEQVSTRGRTCEAKTLINCEAEAAGALTGCAVQSERAMNVCTKSMPNTGGSSGYSGTRVRRHGARVPGMPTSIIVDIERLSVTRSELHVSADERFGQRSVKDKAAWNIRLAARARTTSVAITMTEFDADESLEGYMQAGECSE